MTHDVDALITRNTNLGALGTQIYTNDTHSGNIRGLRTGVEEEVRAFRMVRDARDLAERNTESIEYAGYGPNAEVECTYVVKWKGFLIKQNQKMGRCNMEVSYRF